MSVALLDRFTVGADTDLNDHGDWEEVNVGAMVVEADTDQIEVATTGADQFAGWNGTGVPTGDQYIRARVRMTASAGYVGLVSRKEVGNDTCYVALLAGSEDLVEIYRVVNGSLTQLASTAFTVATDGTDYILELLTTGTGSQVDLVFRVDHAQVLTFSDTDAARLTSGVPGVYGFVATTRTSQIDDVIIADEDVEFLAPDAVISSSVIDTSGGVANVDDNPFAPDANEWPNAGSDGNVRVSFGTPAGTPDQGTDLQAFFVRLRKSAVNGGTPTFSAELRETGGGSALQTLATNQALANLAAGEVFELRWDAANLATADGSAVELLLTFTSDGNGGNARHVEVDAIQWATLAGAAAGEAREVTDGIALGDSVARQAAYAGSATDGIDLGDSVVAQLTSSVRSVTDGITLGDAADAGTARSVSDGITLGDAVAATWSLLRSVSDGIVLGDSVVGSQAAQRSLTDGIVLGENIETALTIESGPDGILLGEAVQVTWSLPRSVTDGMLLGDSATNSPQRALIDGIVLGEDIDTTLTVDTGPDGISLGDSVQVTWSIPRSVSDGLALGESVSAGSARSVTDGLVLGDATAETWSLPRSVTDGLALGESVASQITSSVRAPTDGIVLGDIAETGDAAVRSATDGLVLGDAVVRQAAYTAASADGLLLGDAAARVAAYPASATDGLRLGDSAATVWALNQALTDGLVLGDSVATGIELFPARGDIRSRTGKINVLGRSGRANTIGG